MAFFEKREGRPRRANAGNLFEKLLEQGLDAEEEELLQRLDEVSSDSSFTAVSSSDSDAADMFDSDFSDEEEEGVLEGEAVETDATARRAERKEKSAMKKRQLQRVRNFSHGSRAAQRLGHKRQRANSRQQQQQKRKRQESERGGEEGHDAKEREDDDNGSGSDDDEEEEEEEVDLRQAVRKRKPPTIPLERRMAEALARAKAIREQQQQQQADLGRDGDQASAAAEQQKGINLLTSLQQHGVAGHRRRRGAAGRYRGAGDASGTGTGYRYPFTAAGGRGWTDTGFPIGEAEGADVSTFFSEQPPPSSPPPPASTAAAIASGSFLDRNKRMWLYAGSRAAPRQGQRVQYHSSAKVLTQLGTPVVISFSLDLPPAFTPATSK